MYVGVELVLRHIRNGVELDPIDLNRNYDFNFQQLNVIPRVQVFPVSMYLNYCCYSYKMCTILSQHIILFVQSEFIK